MDYRSLELSYEINTYTYNEDIAKENKEIFLADLEECKEILAEEWKKRPWYRKISEPLMRLFGPLL